ncbi:MAG TPA: CTP synthase, partial [Chitinispirillaceae bacterium]|nr:CTP synthase [Chitinispirillaceae bacterium]
IAIVGKYSELPDAYKSIHEALNHAAAFHNARVKIVSVSAEEIEKSGAETVLKNIGAILVPGGFGSRGTEGKIAAIQFARENNVPFLGICLGMHMAVIEFARNVLKLADANSTEINPKTSHPVIHLMEEQKKVLNLGASMRLGAYPCALKKGTIAYKGYEKEIISERHRHRYEFNNDYRDCFEKGGMIISGQSPDGILVEMIELQDHPWFIASQFHPEFKSRPIDPHPLFRDFLGISLNLNGYDTKESRLTK